MLLPIFPSGLSFSSSFVGIPLPISSSVRSLAMVPFEFMCRVEVLFLAQVFPTPSRSCCLPFSAVLFVGFPELLPSSWLFPLWC
ncbi:hypothetical protein C1H46_004533 [Malus baccata]|uniref:Uncharacterized protein n=1 Tax=Malus baccata TaxID=106549 RepID=A0A540NFF5_MALBA|nr:hypothetical protein C1H46_004533 [Malus baccata]